MGASSHSTGDREIDDFYATDPEAIDGLAKMIDIPHVVLEPACGMGHLSKRLEELGHKVYSYDKVDRGYGKVQDFFFVESLPEDCSCIITNPPYRQHLEFILKALELLPDGGLCCMFSKTIYLEGVDRYEKLYRNYPPPQHFTVCKACKMREERSVRHQIQCCRLCLVCMGKRVFWRNNSQMDKQ